ncbi:hypothetical protein E2C01_100730 [Portunus trituberculatus]|uniref:Uncharacterized protein n=1 Tax=Portunus trituberculatus TaxID=210409 RepID=A0A5B7K3W3_PORTR|nr:hypothetical protein [Portunus trituberculatus]
MCSTTQQEHSAVAKRIAVLVFTTLYRRLWSCATRRIVLLLSLQQLVGCFQWSVSTLIGEEGSCLGMCGSCLVQSTDIVVIRLSSGTSLECDLEY